MLGTGLDALAVRADHDRTHPKLFGEPGHRRCARDQALRAAVTSALSSRRWSTSAWAGNRKRRRRKA